MHIPGSAGNDELVGLYSTRAGWLQFRRQRLCNVAERLAECSCTHQPSPSVHPQCPLRCPRSPYVRNKCDKWVSPALLHCSFTEPAAGRNPGKRDALSWVAPAFVTHSDLAPAALLPLNICQVIFHVSKFFSNFP